MKPARGYTTNERPPDLLPNPTENPDIIEVMNLSITRIDEDTIEVMSMTSMVVNTWFKVIYIAILLATLTTWFDPGWFNKEGRRGGGIQAIERMFTWEASFQRTFAFYEDPNNPGYTGSGMSYEDFMIEMLELHGRGIVPAVSIILLLIVIPLFLFNIAILNPYRIDRKRRIIYTWGKGSFLCMKLPEHTDDPLSGVEAHTPLLEDPDNYYNVFGPLNIWLPYPKKQKNAGFSLGAVCNFNWSIIPYQSYYLHDFINDFLDNPDPKWLNQLGFKRKPKCVSMYTYLTYLYARIQFLPQFPFKKRKTQQAIEEFMKNPRTELYPDYLPYG